MNNYTQKCKLLIQKIENYTTNNIIIAFSGGVDSSLLLKLACNSAATKGTKVYAVTIKSELQPKNDIEIARAVAIEIGAIHKVLNIDELSGAKIKNNPINRCYLCKKYFFTQLKNMAESLDISVILEGTNEDDMHIYRPGIQALKELNILSPLAEVKMTKSEVRTMANEYNISVAQRPSSPCLATRFPYETTLSKTELLKVEKGETFLINMGFKNVRMRIYNDLVRLEFDKDYIDIAFANKDKIIDYIKNLGYSFVCIDLEGFRSGSMDHKK